MVKTRKLRSEVSQPAQVGYVRLDEMIESYVSQGESSAGPVERWSFAIALLGAGAGLLLGALLDKPYSTYAAVTGLFVELSGLGIWTVLFFKREWASLRHAKRTLARELDADFDFYVALVHELRRHPLEELRRRHRFIRDRNTVMKRRIGFFSGGIEKLGVLPVLAVLYFQFRDWEWGDWSMLAEVNLVQGLLVWALLLGFALSWRLVGLHNRIEAYDLLLAEAIHESSSANRH